MVLPDRIELSTSPLPRGCSTTELRQPARLPGIHEASPLGKARPSKPETDRGEFVGKGGRARSKYSRRVMRESIDGQSRELFQLRNGIRVLQKLIRRQHGDAVPRADLVAERATDAAGEVDRADLEDALVAGPGDGADAIDRADHEARLAAGAHVLVEERQDLGELLLRHWLNGLYVPRFCEQVKSGAAALWEPAADDVYG